MVCSVTGVRGQLCAVDGGEERGEFEAFSLQVPHATGLLLTRSGVAVLSANVLQITSGSLFTLSALGVPETHFSVVALSTARLRSEVLFAIDLPVEVHSSVAACVCVSTSVCVCSCVTSSVGVSWVVTLRVFRCFVFICRLTPIRGTPKARSFTTRLRRQQSRATVIRIMRVTFNALLLFGVPKTGHSVMGLIITALRA